MMQRLDELERLVRIEVDKGLKNAEQRLEKASQDVAVAFQHLDRLVSDPEFSARNQHLIIASEAVSKAETDISHYREMKEALLEEKITSPDDTLLKKIRHAADQLSTISPTLNKTLDALTKLRGPKWEYSYSVKDKEERLTRIIEEALSRKSTWPGAPPKTPHVDFGRAGGVELKLGDRTIELGGHMTPQDAVELLARNAANAAPPNSDTSLIRKQYVDFMTTEGQSLAQDPLRALHHDLTYQNYSIDLQPTLGQLMYYQLKEGSAKLIAYSELKVGCAVVPDRGTFIYRTDAGTIQETDDGRIAKKSKNPLMTVVTELELDATNTNEPMKAQYSRFELSSYSNELHSEARNQASPNPPLTKEALQELKGKEPVMTGPSLKRG